MNDPWFQNDVEYGLAGLYLGPRNDDRKLFDRYLKSKPVLYDVPEYVRFFSGFYEGYMMRFGYAKAPDQFIAFVRNARADSLKAMLARNDFMRDPQVNELVLITGLYTEHGNKQFDPRGVLAVLGVAGTFSFSGEPEDRGEHGGGPHCHATRTAFAIAAITRFGWNSGRRFGAAARPGLHLHHHAALYLLRAGIGSAGATSEGVRGLCAIHRHYGARRSNGHACFTSRNIPLPLE